MNKLGSYKEWRFNLWSDRGSVIQRIVMEKLHAVFPLKPFWDSGNFPKFSPSDAIDTSLSAPTRGSRPDWEGKATSNRQSVPRTAASTRETFFPQQKHLKKSKKHVMSTEKNVLNIYIYILFLLKLCIYMIIYVYMHYIIILIHII